MCRIYSEYENFLRDAIGIRLSNSRMYDNATDGFIDILKGNTTMDCFETSFSNSSYVRDDALCCWINRYADLMALDIQNLIGSKDLIEKVIFKLDGKEIIFNTLEEAERLLIPICGLDSSSLRVKFRSEAAIPDKTPIIFRSYFISDIEKRNNLMLGLASGAICWPYSS